MPDHEDRNFASKVICFNAGYDRIRSLDFDIIGNLDADLSFEPDYFEFLLARLIEFPNLGVAGTPFIQESSQYDYRFTNIDHVSGACQLFRRSCFEDVGGYVPIKEGGIDWIAVTTARMKGWTTRTFLGKSLYHYRKMGTGKSSPLGALFKLGKQDYSLGNHPLWEFLRMFYQMRFKPYLISGPVLFAGYMTATIQGTPRPISPKLVEFIRKEQLQRLLENITPIYRGRESHIQKNDRH
jgi:glycosyltransferase involved in cell wall biosynthesis